jgi:hypothetical protein
MILRVLPFLLVLSACVAKFNIRADAPNNFRPLNASPRKLIPRAERTVDLYVTLPPSRPFVEVGTWMYFGEPADVSEKARPQAAVVGCDALILGRYVVPERTTEVVCIVYSDLPATYRPEPHPCTPMLAEAYRISDPERRRDRLSEIPADCVRMRQPQIAVAGGTAASN